MNSEKSELIGMVGGGLFGVISIIAAIVEYHKGDNGALAGCVKDVSGTLIVVILLIAFIISLKKPKNIEELTETAVEKWGDDNAPLIFKAEGYVAAKDTNYTQGFVLLQNPRSFVSLSNSKLSKNSTEWSKYAQYGNIKLTGKFLDLPSYKSMTEGNFDVLFVMEQKHFKDMPEIDQVINDIVPAINANCDASFCANRVGSSNKIRVSCPKIEKKENVESFVNMLDFVASLVKIVA